ncbi:MAG: TerC family protein, partial [Candidatus Omnitrophica bacterium]|nr:TerC family protein [Candidatus Omnitrophota bacterium]
ALLLIESSDVIFAMDSIPAVLAITTDPFIVYTSNIFAILGLRSLFFVISGMMGLFRYLKLGISAILCFVGVKMLVSHFYEIPITASLGVVFGILILSIVISVLYREEGGK